MFTRLLYCVQYGSLIVLWALRQVITRQLQSGFLVQRDQQSYSHTSQLLEGLIISMGAETVRERTPGSNNALSRRVNFGSRQTMVTCRIGSILR